MAKMNGVVTGQVVSTDDPDQQGRVQVSLPFLGGQNESYWAPVATMLAGGSTGSWFMPETGDEVLVAFNQEDVNHPYIIGFLWNGQDQPPDTNPKHRTIKTPGKHVLQFDDTDGSTKITLQSAGGQTVVIDDSGTGSITVTGNTGGSITLQGGGRILTLSNSMVQIS
jgi:uncharacterized protein involved in type VI secretion and phage assembly